MSLYGISGNPLLLKKLLLSYDSHHMTAQLHLPHQISFAVRSSDKELAVTLAALIAGIDVKLVAEECIGIKGNIFYRVALGAAAGDAEGSFTIMTATA